MTETIRSYIRARPRLRRLALFGVRISAAVFYVRIASVLRCVTFLWEWYQYRKRSDPDVILKILDWYPCLRDKTASHTLDAHYFYQDIWAFKRISRNRPPKHVDIGSRAIFVGMLSTITEVIFIDIRPLHAQLDNYQGCQGSILSLPFRDNSVMSLSCLSVAEHIGLGRYGDLIDPAGTLKACRELARVLAPGGHLYFSVPIGQPRICFNAHRVHTAEQVLGYFPDLHLIEFSGVDDKSRVVTDRVLDSLDHEDLGCGFFWFQKRQVKPEGGRLDEVGVLSTEGN